MYNYDFLLEVSQTIVRIGLKYGIPLTVEFRPIRAKVPIIGRPGYREIWEGKYDIVVKDQREDIIFIL